METSIEPQSVTVLLWPLVTLIMNLSVVAVLWFGGNLVNTGSLEIGKIMAFINYLVQIMGSLNMMVMIIINFSRAKVSATRINEVLDIEPSIVNKDDSKEINNFDIEFKDVYFKYNKDSDYVLSGISFKAKEGEKIGIIGATGSGKSSLVSLIPRLYDTTMGSITIGNEDVRNLKIDELREYIRDRSIELLVLKQPMARDLRYIYALGFIALELERIGDYAVNIAEETIKICQDEYIKDLIDIPKMYEECKKMILEVKESLENENEDLAREIALQDDKIDSLYNRVQEDCLRVMNANPQTINQGVNLLFIGRYLERIGDHITNICEMIIFAINGEMTEIG